MRHRKNLIKGAVRCLKENGFKYTLKRIEIKIFSKTEKTIRTGRLIPEENEYVQYVRYLENIFSLLRNPVDNLNFVKITKTKYHREPGDTKVVAWYLPQYYQTEVNDRYHGKGFTEWTCTTRTIPLFCGHNQPQLPYDLGYYNLTDIETIKRQVELASMYGVYGFCFDYYWFSGERTMEKPVELFFRHKEINFPFCMHWCTENWTALWDGENKELIYEMKLREGDDKKFMDDILPYMLDDRYIKIDGKPILMIYICTMFGRERFKKLMDNFRKYAAEAGIPGLYIMLTNGKSFDDDVSRWGADALVEYPTITMGRCDRMNIEGYLNPGFKNDSSLILDMKQFIKEKRYICNHKASVVFRSALTNFDNSPRKAYSENCYITANANPKTYKTWLKGIMRENKTKHSREDDYVFVLAWNEWAESSHLEPDMMYGYGYLQATKEAIEEVRDIKEDIVINEWKAKKAQGINLCFYVHCIESLGDIIACEPIARYLKRLDDSAKVVWIVRKKYAGAVRFNPNIDEIIEIEDLNESMDLLMEIKKHPENIVVDCHYDGRIAPITGRVHFNENNPQVNEATYYDYGPLLKNFCFSAGLPGLMDAPIFHLNPNVKLPFKLPEKYVVFHCRSSEGSRDWELEKWSALARNIIEAGYYVVEIGFEPSITDKSGMYVDCTDIRDIQVIARIVKGAICFFGVDSAFAHVANCFDVFGIILIGKYKNFNYHIPYTGNYFSRKTAVLLYSDRTEAKAIEIDTVLMEFNKRFNVIEDYQAFPLFQGNCLQEDTRYHVDEIYDAEEGVITLKNGDCLQLRGWAIDISANSVPAAVYLGVGDHYYRLQMYHRPDVVSYLQDKDYLNSGFCGCVRINGLRNGKKYEPQLLIVANDNNSYYLKSAQFTIALG